LGEKKKKLNEYSAIPGHLGQLPKLKVEIFAEYRATRYGTVLQHHMPANVLQNLSEIPPKLFSSVRKPLAAFLRLATR